MRQIQLTPNPQIAVQNLLNQNPNLQAVLNLTRNGTSLQQVAQVMAAQKGIDLNQLVRELSK